MFQVLEDKVLQVEVFNDSSRKEEIEKGRDSICGQTTKNVVREETSMFHMEKSTEVL